MRLLDLVETSRAVAEVSGRVDKIVRLAALLERLAPEEIETAVAFLTGSPRQGRIGVGWSVVTDAKATAVPAGEASLDLRDVDALFDRVTRVIGNGSTIAKGTLLRDLFARATLDEQEFLVRLLFGELRQGALEGVLVEAVAHAARLPGATVRRAAMMTGDLGTIARAALVEGEAALARVVVRIFRPLQPMLAHSAKNLDEAWTRLPEASLEFKLDGARVQVHKADDEVRVFSRNLRDVTPAVPEIVEVVRALPARELILDGEAIALRPDASPHPFQTTMRRFGRRLDVEALRRELPLTPFFFDALHLDGQSLVDEPQARRVDVLSGLVAPAFVIPRAAAPTRAEAEAFLDEALRRGHEGVMAKAMDAPYAAGSRGQAWLKIKRARTLDLVVLAAEWGHGRRWGWLSNLHLGARDAEGGGPDRLAPHAGGFVMLGKTFKGMTDALLAWQTQHLRTLEIGRDRYTVYVRPELVVEIAFNDIQESPQYPGGLALRFARVKRYRTDKTAAEADTLAAVQEIFRQTTGKTPPPRR